MKNPKSKEGCLRQINALIRAYEHDFAGGGAFGYDLPTFKLNSPERYERYMALRKMWHELPYRNTLGLRIEP